MEKSEEVEACGSSTVILDSVRNAYLAKRKSELGSLSVGKKPCIQFLEPRNDSLCEETKYDLTISRESILTPTSSLLDNDDERNCEVFSCIESFLQLSAADRLEALEQLVSVCDSSQIRHLRTILEPHFKRDFLSLLPKELSLYILSYLDPADLMNAAQTCRYWRTLTEDSLIWKEICEEEGIEANNFPPPLSRRFGEVPSCTGSKLPSCYSRSQFKALYIRQRRIEENWRRNSKVLEPSILRGHDDHVITCLLLHNDKIISGSDDNTLRIWSVITGECLHVLSGHSGGVWSCQLTSDGRYVVSGATDRTVRVWNMETGEAVHVLHGHTSTVRCMAVHDYTAVTGSRDATLRVWNVEHGHFEFVLHGHLCAIRCVQFDGRRVVSGAYDYTVRVWDIVTRSCIYTLEGHSNRIYSLEFHSQRDLVVSGSLDTTIRVWDLKSGQCLHTLVGHRSLNSDVQLCSSGTLLVSGNADSTIKVWDVISGQCLQTLAGPFKHQSAVTCLQLLSSGLVVTSSDDGTVKLWDTHTGDFVRDLIKLGSSGTGGVIWRMQASSTMLVCAVGSRTGVEDTKLLILDFNAEYP